MKAMRKAKSLSEHEIDEIVVAQADDDSAWKKPFAYLRKGTLLDACDYCDGTVYERIVEREVFQNKNGLVILENVPIGVCEKCGEHYYSADVLRKVHAIATGRAKPSRSELIPIARYA